MIEQKSKQENYDDTIRSIKDYENSTQCDENIDFKL